MKRFYSRKAKILLAIACTFFFVCFCLSVIAFHELNRNGFRDEFRKRVYDNAGNAYAVQALSKYQSGFNVGFLNRMNCYYGIIEGYVSPDIDLNDPSIYLCHNFEGIPVPKDDYFIYSYVINSKTVFDKTLDLIGLPREDRINTDLGEMKPVVYDIQGVGYDHLGKKAYVYANDSFYALSRAFYEYSDSYSVTSITDVDSTYRTIWNKNKPNESIEDATEGNEKLYIGGEGYDPISKVDKDYKLFFRTHTGTGILSGDYIADLSPLHDSLKNVDTFAGTRFADMANPTQITTKVEDPENMHYTFVCFPDEAKLLMKNHENDYYAKAQKIVKAADVLHLILPVIGMIVLLLQWGCFVLFMKAAGHTDLSEEIAEGPIEKIPIDLTLIITVIVEIILFYLIIVYSSLQSFYLALISIIVVFILVSVVWLIFCSSLAVNFKLHRLHKNCLFMKQLMIFGWKTRIWIIYGIATLVLFWIMKSFTDTYNFEPKYFILFFIDKAILALAIFLWIRSYSKIKGTVEKLAEGDTTARVDVTGMPQFMRDTGEAINDIQEGIEIALVERTKSERLKTELLTNVSHDIKTPITSIINYVDLLDKEKLKNDNAKEYIEVLNRQSLRLKKLVEDLIEASKVTTGNIEFDMEQVNAGVLLDQSIGEFTERLEKNNIEVVVNNEDGEMMLRADNRYLWRVFDNIMSNIVKYAQANTRAYVDLKKDGDKLRFIFRNTSRDQLNISPEELMERFVRGDKSRYTDGNGLGLSIARSLTEAMGGTMNIFIDGDFIKVILEFDAIVESGE